MASWVFDKADDRQSKWDDYEKDAPWLASFKTGCSISSTVQTCFDTLEQHPRTDGIEEDGSENVLKRGLACLAEVEVSGVSSSVVNTHFLAIRAARKKFTMDLNRNRNAARRSIFVEVG